MVMGQFWYIKILTWLWGLGEYNERIDYSSLILDVISFVLFTYTLEPN